MRRALISGGTKGLGLAIARELASADHEVVVTYAHDDESAKSANGDRIRSVKCDVTRADEVDAFFQREGDFDVFVHSAGFRRDKLMMMMSESDFDDVIDVHLKGGFLIARRVIKGMIAKKFGRILFVVSPSAFLGRAGQTNYAAAKAGLTGMTRSLAREVARFRITVNALSSGFVETGLTRDLSDTARKEILSGIPLGRAGLPEEISWAARFLASDRASYITGQVLGVDGGLT